MPGTFPLLRVRADQHGCLHALTSLAPTQTSEAWWQDVLQDPRVWPRTRRDDRDIRESYTLRDTVNWGRTLDIACRKCDRRQSHRTVELANLYGERRELPSLLEELVKDCPRAMAKNYGDWCGAIYDGTIHPHGETAQEMLARTSIAPKKDRMRDR
jgi:hypothetical protein